MIFSAGFGTRMRPLTQTLPKPMVPVAGLPLIDRAIGLARDAGVGTIVVNLHYLPQKLRSHLSGYPDIRFSDESDMILDTGGGLKAAIPLLAAPDSFTLNPDVVWTGQNPLSELSDAWEKSVADCLVLLVPVAAALGYAGNGDFDIDGNGRVRRGHDYIYAGAQIVRMRTLDEIPDRVFSLNRLWDRLSERSTLFGIVHKGDWCDVGRTENIPLAEALLKND